MQLNTLKRIRNIHVVFTPNRGCPFKFVVARVIVTLVFFVRSVVVLAQDCYYRSLSEEEHARACANNYNFDHPAAFDFPRIHSALRAIRNGTTTTSVPSYGASSDYQKPS